MLSLSLSGELNSHSMLDDFFAESRFTGFGSRVFYLSGVIPPSLTQHAPYRSNLPSTVFTALVCLCHLTRYIYTDAPVVVCFTHHPQIYLLVSQAGRFIHL
jgi:hypothetical protein